jgi:5-amino-6-(5-phosphoribosylamino)uracil reductase
MIASADGAVTVEGRSGGLAGPGDRALFRALRSLADVVLAGGRTVAIEGYGPPTLPDELAAARRARGQAPLPRVAVVTRTCSIDLAAALFARPTSRPVVITAEDAPAERRAAAAEVADVIAVGAGGIDLVRALALLGEAGAGSVLCEGGPSLFGLLAAADLVDELCLTVAPLLTAGPAGRIVSGPALGPLRLELASMCDDEDGYLYVRYRAVR